MIDKYSDIKVVEAEAKRQTEIIRLYGRYQEAEEFADLIIAYEKEGNKDPKELLGLIIDKVSRDILECKKVVGNY